MLALSPDPGTLTGTGQMDSAVDAKKSFHPTNNEKEELQEWKNWL